MDYRIVIALAALCFATTALAGQVYRWEDDSGQIHYGQQPPKNAEAEPVSTYAAPSDDSSSEQADEEGGDQASKEKGSDGMGEKVDAKQVNKQCQQARKSISNLKQEGPDAQYTNADGELVTYSKSEHQQLIKENQEFIDAHCDDSGDAQASN